MNTPSRTKSGITLPQAPVQLTQPDSHRAQSVQKLLPKATCQIWGGTAAKQGNPVTSNNFRSTGLESTGLDSRNQLTRAQSTGWSESIQSVLEQPPAALPRYLILLGLAFTGFFVLWAWTGKMQEVSQATGELLPLGDTYKIQPATAGELDKVWVKEGDRVRQGQLLFELDATSSQSEISRLEQTLTATQQQLDQTLVLISDMHDESVTQAQIAAASIQAQIATQEQSQTTTQTNQALLEGLEREMTAQQERLSRISALESQGAISKEYLFGIEQGVRDQQKAITQTQGEMEQALAHTRQVTAELDQKRAEAQQAKLISQQSLQKLSIEAEQLQATLDDTQILLTDAKARLAQSKVRSPSSGILSSLEIDNTGEFIQLGQTLAEVVPSSTPLVLSAIVPQSKAGLIKPGMTAQIKLDAFPYQTYGVMSGKVLSISPDAKGNPETGSGYQVHITLEKDYVMHEKKPVPLHVGQTASAEIIVSQRRILDLILDPIRRLRSDEMTL